MIFAGQTVSGTIDKVAAGGLGVLRVDGFVIFVPFTLPGEQVQVRIDSVHKNYARGSLTELLSSSLKRTTPKCPYFGRCGGCQLQHMEYALQLEHKHEVIVDAFHKIAKLSLPPFEVRGTDLQWEYRRHIKLQKRSNKLGFVGCDNKTLVEVDRCAIFSDKPLSSYADGFKEEGDSFVIDDLTVFFSRAAFLQSHPLQSEALYLDLCQMVLPLNPSFILDLYCGIGVTTLLLAKRGYSLLGIEMSKEAIRQAKKSLTHNGLTAEFVSALAEDFKISRAVDLCIVNPPRTGLSSKVVEKLLRLNPKHLLYISCMPQTLARDVSRLGYKVESLTAYDMFPQTAHVETLMHLSSLS